MLTLIFVEINVSWEWNAMRLWKGSFTLEVLLVSLSDWYFVVHEDYLEDSFLGDIFFFSNWDVIDKFQSQKHIQDWCWVHHSFSTTQNLRTRDQAVTVSQQCGTLTSVPSALLHPCLVITGALSLLSVCSDPSWSGSAGCGRRRACGGHQHPCCWPQNPRTWAHQRTHCPGTARYPGHVWRCDSSTGIFFFIL